MYNVLIVDDEPRICAGLKVFIDWEAYGFKVIETAQDGEDAIDKLKKNRYNLVITDIRMPEVDGLELIKEIYNYNSSVKLLIISGYNNFEYAREAMKYGVRGYLLKPLNRDDLLQHVLNIKDELDKEVENMIKDRGNNSIRLNKFLFDVANGNLAQKDISVKMQEYRMDMSKGGFLLALIEIEDYYHTFESNLEEANLVKFGLRNIVEEIILQKKIGYVYEDINNTLGIIFFSYMSGLSEETVKSCLQNICNCIKQYLKININIGYGNCVKKLEVIKESRKQAQIALERRIILGKENVIPYSSVMVNEKSILDLKWRSENLLAAIEVADKNKIEAEVDLVISEICRKCFPNEVINAIAYNIILEICAMIKSYNGEAVQVIKKEDVNIINSSFRTIEQLKDWLMSICIKTCDYKLELQECKSSSVFTQIKKYIDDNYYNDLSLKSLAEIFYMSPAYLGRLFKNNMGESFNDYLNKVRISEVKKRFLQEDSKIYDILAKVGYSNHEHFYRQFKRYEEKSFAEYKESIRAKKPQKL